MAILVGLATVISTLLGGIFALRFKDKLHLILGFSAGAVIGVAFFDLMPEALNLGSASGASVTGGAHYAISTITSIVAGGFVLFMVLDRLVRLHRHAGNMTDDIANIDGAENADKNSGRLGAGSLSIHSFLDGLAIGLAFKVSAAVGIIIAIAVLVHDFSDGINTVNLILKNNGSRKQAFRWLVVDAAAPAVGVFSTFFFSVQESTLGILLAIFCGFFLHIGASDLLPESYHRHSSAWTTLSTILGVATLFIAVRLAAGI